MLPFSGAAKPLTETEIQRAADALGCEVEAVQAVLTVETGGTGGFLADGSGRPKILFEAEHFGHLTGYRYNDSYPTLSTSAPNWKLYLGGAAEYDRLTAAWQLDAPSALRATSWGLFQVLGDNYRAGGYADVDAMVDAMCDSESEQLGAFVGFCKVNNLDTLLRKRDWTGFAASYNGRLFAVNHYDTRLAEAYDRAKTNRAPSHMLTIGCQGGIVKDLQAALNDHGSNLVADGVFGPATRLAIMRLQDAAHLPATGDLHTPADVGFALPAAVSAYLSSSN